MSSEHFLSCLSMSFEHVLISLNRSHKVHIYLGQILNKLKDKNNENENDKSNDNDNDNHPSQSEAGMAVLDTNSSETNATVTNNKNHELMTSNQNSIDVKNTEINRAHNGNVNAVDDDGAIIVKHSVDNEDQKNTYVDAMGGTTDTSKGGQVMNLHPPSPHTSNTRISEDSHETNHVETATNNSNNTTTAISQTSKMVSGTYDEAIEASQSCIQASCELAQKTLTQLLSLRRESTARLPLEKMKFLWEISLFFILSVERLTKSTAYIMRQCLLSQGKLFLEYLTESLKSKLVSTLDNERWVQCDVSLERQKELDRLTSGKAFLPKNNNINNNPINHNHNNDLESSGTSDISENEDHPNNSNLDNQTHGITKKKEPTSARVDATSFRVVWSVMFVIEIIMIFLDITVNFSPVTTDIISKTVEILRLFDSRTKQLVLGAQAIQSSARLKSIAAKHLCVTAQSLGLLLAILPHIRAALLAQLAPKHHMLLTELDRVQHSIIDHQSQILSKFVSIVSDFVDASAMKLKSVDWDRFQGQCEYFDDVQRNITALHRVLQSVLPTEQVQDVFSRIFLLLNRKVVQHFEDIMPSTQTGRQRILDEVVHLVNSCSVLKQVDASVITLEDTFRIKFGK